MGITEKQIKDYTGYTMYERGRSYFRQKLVHEYREEETSPGHWTLEAEVEGSSDYDVKLEVSEDWIRGDCTCPYAYICKHMAAVLITFMESHKEPPKPTSSYEIKSLIDRYRSNVPMEETEEQPAETALVVS